MNSIIFITLALSVYDKTFENDQKWIRYKKDYSKTYLDTSEEVKRYTIFKEKDEMIKVHNEKFEHGEVTYTVGHNQFSDMNAQEFAEMYLSPQSSYEENFAHDLDHNMTFPEAPSSLSYQKYCLEPLSQGRCGSCWAFSAAAQIEAQLCIKHNLCKYLSPQYLLDCSNSGNCESGGYAFKALEFMKNYGGVFNSNYPYYGVKYQCNKTPKRYELGIKNVYNQFIKGNEETLKNYLATYGPIVISMMVKPSFHQYSSGIYYDSSCPGNCGSSNHAMVLVGYGRDKYDYWLVKNSWGTGWGDNGYVKMIRNYNNNCNIACNPQFGVV